MRSQADFDAVQALLSKGLTCNEVARRTGVPRATVGHWRKKPQRARVDRHTDQANWRPSNAAAYSYLLGLYLGDGCLWLTGNHSATLSIYLDARYQEIVGSAREAMSLVAPASTVRQRTKPGCIVVYASTPVWRAAFPQHGPGRKHTRPIELTDWQRELTTRHPEALLRGLIHSDGCRCVNRFTIRLPKGGNREYAYVRYFFTNLSTDIRRIFCEHCDLIGVRWTQSNFKSISVSDRKSIAVLDSFIGPKE